MKSRSLNHSKNNVLILLITLTVSLLLLQCKDHYSIILKKESGNIDGNIENYDRVFKSGKLTYFDALSRTVQNEIFEIDSTGCFKVLFNLTHPTYNTPVLDLQGHYFSLFLEPGKDLKISISGNKINFIGESGLSNIQINLIEDSINSKFKKEIKRCDFLHTTNIGYKDYLKEQISLSNKILNFIEEFDKTHNLNKEVLNAVKKEAYYSPAKSWINFRYDYTDGPPKERDTLFTGFYKDLFKEYPINDRNALVSREYIDYISNIKDVLSQQESYDSLYNYIKRLNSFSAEDLVLIKRAYSGDKSVFTSEEIKLFYNDTNRKKMAEFGNRYRVKKLLLACKDLPNGIGRDLVISQGICSYYFAKYYMHPTEDEWNSIKGLIDTKFILENLFDLDNKLKIDLPANQLSKEIPESVKKLAVNLNNEIIGKYKDKVIYIDFWATWCGPCRQEIPYSKVLVEQFKNKDVVFLSLCCKSNKQDWENTIAHEKIPGEHYFVKDVDYDLLSSIYGINGFPTYILIDRNGEIKNFNAPRPSSNKLIMNEIQTLLD
jgi:thiol-disulfide isomerase/thioredoxin